MKNNNFFNRELSWLEFNQRVLEEVTYAQHPLFERLNFAAIVYSNLDEFFMNRVASVQDQIEAGLETRDPSGYTAAELMEKISRRVHCMMAELYEKYNEDLRSDLKKERIRLLKTGELNTEQQAYLDDYFERIIFPVLTPMVVDSGRPFPLVLDKSLNIALLVGDSNNQENHYFATVQVPAVLDRVLEVSSGTSSKTLILLEEVIKSKLQRIFTGYQILAVACYRITRNAGLDINEEGAEDLLEAIEASLKQRKWGAAIRLEIENEMDDGILDILMDELEIDTQEVYRIPGPLDLNFLKKIASLKGRERLRYAAIEPVLHKAFLKQEDIFTVIRSQDVLLHHPYHSFAPVIQLVQKAAEDPQVLAIKQTLYRVSEHSSIVEALAQAAENGKQVTVMVELKARFDERNNIQWARRLEKAGCHVIYGFAGLKTHCKVLLVVRREEDGIRRYVHLSTGNYNDATAHLYTDIGLFTANPYFGMDASNLFNMLSGLSQPLDMHRFVVAPYELREKMLKLIAREKSHAEKGKKALIIAKMNSLVDRDVIEALYAASGAGVEIKLLVRGICCLVPNLPGVSEHITVTSIVGRFLEHSRIFYFYNDGSEAIYLSSADIMERNLNRRIEVMFPIDDEKMQQEVKRILEISLNDTEKARVMTEDGTYLRAAGKSKQKVNSQSLFYEETQREHLPKSERSKENGRKRKS